MAFIAFLNWAGGVSCSIGGLLALVSWAKGKEARQLGAATSVDSLAGGLAMKWQRPSQLMT